MFFFSVEEARDVWWVTKLVVIAAIICLGWTLKHSLGDDRPKDSCSSQVKRVMELTSTRIERLRNKRESPF
jgi:hypothetical protein